MPSFILGADHGGFALKEHVRKSLERLDVRYEDLTPAAGEGDDYPPVAQRAARHVAAHPELQAVLVCRSGFGMDIAANRFKGVRATVARNAAEARQAREHNHANVLVLGEEWTTPAQADQILRAWLDARPSQAARHLRRIHLIDAL